MWMKTPTDNGDLHVPILEAHQLAFGSQELDVINFLFFLGLQNRRRAMLRKKRKIITSSSCASAQVR